MFDFIKINYSNTGYILPTTKIDFKSDLNRNTGELEETLRGSYFDFDITRYPSGRTMVSGSIHKFFNRLEFNANDFSLTEMQRSVLDLEREIGLIPALCKLENVEIGVNIQIEFNPNLVLENLLFHRSEEFNKPIAGAFYFQSVKTEYIIKAYNKTAQNKRILNRLRAELKTTYLSNAERAEKEALAQLIETELKSNTLRFEIKYLKMGALNKIGIYTLADLCKSELVPKLKEILLREFGEVYFYDCTTEISRMRMNEQIAFKDYQNPNYWKTLERKNKFHHKKRFSDLTLKYSQNVKVKISQLIGKKMDGLSVENLDISTAVLKTTKIADTRHNDHSYIGVNCLIKDDESGMSNHHQNLRLCKVTNLNISMQKTTSKFLCSAGLRWYKENDPATYYELSEKYLTNVMRLRDSDDQIYYISHNIRNSASNFLHNRRRFEARNYHPNQMQFRF